jgi:hypothetical protein
MSISSWDRFKIRSEKSQTKFKLKKSALRVNLEKDSFFTFFIFTSYLV